MFCYYMSYHIIFIRTTLTSCTERRINYEEKHLQSAQYNSIDRYYTVSTIFFFFSFLQSVKNTPTKQYFYNILRDRINNKQMKQWKALVRVLGDRVDFLVRDNIFNAMVILLSCIIKHIRRLFGIYHRVDWNIRKNNHFYCTDYGRNISKTPEKKKIIN